MKQISRADDLLVVGTLLFNKKRFPSIKRKIKQTYNISYPSDAFLQIIEAKETEILWAYEGSYFYNRLLRLLAIRPRSEKEVFDFLSANVDNIKTISIVEERIAPFLNDADFAEYFIQKHRAHNPKGDVLLRLLLKEKGISSEIMNEKLANGEETTYDLIKRQVEKKRNHIEAMVERKYNDNSETTKHTMVQQKLTQYLLSKGFSLRDIHSFYQEENI